MSFHMQPCTQRTSPRAMRAKNTPLAPLFRLQRGPLLRDCPPPRPSRGSATPSGRCAAVTQLKVGQM